LKRGDAKALRRAAARLNVSSDETLLEFDIGNFLFLILPEDFPTPLPPKAKRIDLVASDTALYIHSFGIHRRYGWSEILECSFEDEFFHWRERNGHKCQVHMIRGFRPLAQVVSERIEDFERHLDPVESRGRVIQRASYDSQDRQWKERGEILSKQNQYWRALEFEGTVCNSTGETFISSTVCLLTRGIRFSFDATRERLLIPYETIELPEIDLIANSLTAQLLDPGYRSFTVQGKNADTMSHWKTDLDQLMAIQLE
jgi:hypothetical protein